MRVEVSIKVTFLLKFAQWAWGLIPKLINLLCRPKVIAEVKNQNIIYRNNLNAESHASYPCIIISSKKDLKIDVRSIKLNNESFYCMLSRDPHFLRQNLQQADHITIANNKIMPFVHQNWSQLTQKSCWFEIKKHEQEALPLYIHKEMSHFIFNPKKKSRVFFAKSKVILSLNIDGTEYDYGIPLIDLCRIVINNLAFKNSD